MNARKKRRFEFGLVLALVALFAIPASSGASTDAGTRTLEVTATAYNSLPDQGQGDPTIAAWGAKLRPGMKAIAVSRDLIPLGLTNGVEVRIDGLPGTYTVLDKTAKRWKKRIDIYMGVDRQAALDWGKRKVTIHW